MSHRRYGIRVKKPPTSDTGAGSAEMGIPSIGFEVREPLLELNDPNNPNSPNNPMSNPRPPGSR
jgi:hypothetical protein